VEEIPATDEAAANPAPEELFALTSSRRFPEWLSGLGVSIGFTTYRAGKVYFLGAKRQGKLSVFERSFSRCMGMGVSGDGRSILLSTEYQIYRLDNVIPPGGLLPDGTDANYAPHQAWITGDLDVHDIGFGADGRPVFVNTLFSCIATVSDGYSFRPVWRPPFISALAPEDRCHLNGMALQDGVPVYATAVSRSDVADGWRDRRADGGILVDIATVEIVASGLSMPHSPRLHQGKLWLLNSGTGEFGHVDPETGRFEPVAFVPGFARGLAFAGNHAVIGLSQSRESRTFTGLPLEQNLQDRGADARCGLAVIDLDSGAMTAWVRIEGPVVRELYDVTVLPGVLTPKAIGFKTDEVKRVIAIDE
jgi:uncharacterized protein (TIGR03032 family)